MSIQNGNGFGTILIGAIFFALPAAAQNKIGSIKVKVETGDLTQMKADAYIVPQSSNAISNGLGDDVAKAGGRRGVESFRKLVEKKGPQAFGSAHLASSGGGRSKYIINVASIGSGKEKEFKVVSDAMYNALMDAKKKGLKTVAAPVMGFGYAGELTSELSAKAMFSGIQRFVDHGGALEEVTVAVLYNQVTPVFQSILASGSFEEPADAKAIKIKIGQESITSMHVDAYVVPHFDFVWTGPGGYGRVGAAIEETAGRSGLEEFKRYKALHGALPFGEAVVTASGGGNSQFLVNVVTLGFEGTVDEEIQMAADATYNALVKANDKGVTSIAFTPLGYGTFGQLTAEQSAAALAKGIKKFVSGKLTTVNEIHILTYGDIRAFYAFNNMVFSDFRNPEATAAFCGQGWAGNKKK